MHIQKAMESAQAAFSLALHTHPSLLAHEQKDNGRVVAAIASLLMRCHKGTSADTIQAAVNRALNSAYYAYDHFLGVPKSLDQLEPLLLRLLTIELLDRVVCEIQEPPE